MAKTRLMLILLAVSIFGGGGYAFYLWHSEGLAQGAMPQIVAMIALIPIVGLLTWFVYNSEKNEK